MPQLKKSDKFEGVSYEVRGPLLDEAMRMEAAGEKVLKLNIGNPAPFGFRTNENFVQTMAAQLPDTQGYSDSKGMPAAREAIVAYAKEKGIEGACVERAYTGNGVSELINVVLTSLLNRGDEVLIPAPDYPLWTATTRIVGGVPVHYLCDEQAGWYPDIADIRAKVTPRTKALLVINPNNPTGANYPQEVLEELVAIARENDLVILADEIYDRLVFDGKQHVSIASLAPDCLCITFNGLSKSHMMCGYRVGWMVLSGDVSGAGEFIEGLDMMTSMRLCSNTPGQAIVPQALAEHTSMQHYIEPGGRVLAQRDCVYEGLAAIDGISVVKPEAAFYIFPKLDVKKFNITSDEQFAADLLHDKHILITRGMGFSWPEPDHFRIVFLPATDVLQECMDGLADFLSYYRQ